MRAKNSDWTITLEEFKLLDEGTEIFALTDRKDGIFRVFVAKDGESVFIIQTFANWNYNAKCIIRYKENFPGFDTKSWHMGSLSDFAVAKFFLSERDAKIFLDNKTEMDNIIKKRNEPKYFRIIPTFN